MPGPGNYNPGHSHTQSSPRFTFGAKIPPRKPDPGPGPGSHEFKPTTNIKQDAPLGKSDRWQMRKNNVPGPGDYQANTPNK